MIPIHPVALALIQQTESAEAMYLRLYDDAINQLALCEASPMRETVGVLAVVFRTTQIAVATDVRIRMKAIAEGEL